MSKNIRKIGKQNQYLNTRPKNACVLRFIPGFYFTVMYKSLCLSVRLVHAPFSTRDWLYSYHTMLVLTGQGSFSHAYIRAHASFPAFTDASNSHTGCRQVKYTIHSFTVVRFRFTYKPETWPRFNFVKPPVLKDSVLMLQLITCLGLKPL